MFIQTEETPNPATLKFLPGHPVLPQGTAEFRSLEEAGDAPLAQRLFCIQGVEGIFYGSDFISVRKTEDTDWSTLKPLVLEALIEHLSKGQPIFNGTVPEPSGGCACGKSEGGCGGGKDGDITDQIKELLETRVRPVVMQDGGDIVFDSFEDGVVFLKMRGACSGCPGATATLKSGIENMLKHFIPEVTEVRPVQD